MVGVTGSMSSPRQTYAAALSESRAGEEPRLAAESSSAATEADTVESAGAVIGRADQCILSAPQVRGLKIINADGRYRLERDQQIHTAVLSGGGPKGGAYADLPRALKQAGVWDSMTSVRGASAGAITAAVLAAGMDADRFAKLVLDTDFTTLIHDPKSPKLMGDKICQVISERLGSFEKVSSTIGTGRFLGGNGDPLVDLLQRESRSALLSHIEPWLRGAHTDASVSKDVLKQQTETLSKIAETLRAGGKNAVVTFGMLRAVHQVIPAVKEFACTVTRLSEGLSSKGMAIKAELLSADTCPDLDIAWAARASASLPGVFAPVDLTIDGVTQTYIDGGCLSNIPLDHKLDGSVLQDPDQLILKFEGDASPRRSDSLLQEFKDMVTGVENAAHDALTEDLLQQPKWSAQTTTLPVGKVTTFSFRLSTEQKQLLREGGYQAMVEHLSTRQAPAARVQQTFDSLDQLLLALDKPSLAALMQLDHPPVEVKSISQFRDAVETALASSEHRGVVKRLQLAIDGGVVLGQPGDGDSQARQAQLAARIDYLGGRLNQADAKRALQSVLLSDDRDSALWQAVSREQDRQFALKFALDLQHGLVYPAAHIYKLTDAQLASVNRLKDRLWQADSMQAVREALTGFLAEYKAPWVLKMAGFSHAWPDDEARKVLRQMDQHKR